MVKDVTISRIDVSVFRVPVTIPVATSFGVMTSRPAVFVRLTDKDGGYGWGEIFANWPAAGAEHRARLLIEDIADLVIGFHAPAPSALFDYLSRRTHIRALQCGEWGPFRQVIAGLDCALWDLFARRAGVPLARLLNESAASFVPTYASGLDITRAGELIAQLRAQGHDAFKVKVGFDMARDLALLGDIQASLRAGERLFADANQAWDLRQALEFITQTNGLGLGWLEEPIRADQPPAQWGHLASLSRTPLAAGENVTGMDDFTALITAGDVQIIQPDVAKWGGITGCYAVAQAAVGAGRSYCPHFLGGGIGLLASAHLLAAAGGPGMLEMDANPNPLRDAFLSTNSGPKRQFDLGGSAGLGVDALPDDLTPYLTLALSRS
ncbi:MAG: mandelate racemase [Rhodobacteraceae bacterium]|nr:MAG: mandelate racemase [Paracoccaceae bacterium]